jgi:hypothetical protein
MCNVMETSGKNEQARGLGTRSPADHWDDLHDLQPHWVRQRGHSGGQEHALHLAFHRNSQEFETHHGLRRFQLLGQTEKHFLPPCRCTSVGARAELGDNCTIDGLSKPLLRHGFTRFQVVAMGFDEGGGGGGGIWVCSERELFTRRSCPRGDRQCHDHNRSTEQRDGDTGQHIRRSRPRQHRAQGWHSPPMPVHCPRRVCVLSACDVLFLVCAFMSIFVKPQSIPHAQPRSRPWPPSMQGTIDHRQRRSLSLCTCTLHSSRSSSHAIEWAIAHVRVSCSHSCVSHTRHPF